MYITTFELILKFLKMENLIMTICKISVLKMFVKRVLIHRKEGGGTVFRWVLSECQILVLRVFTCIVSSFIL